MIFLAAVLGLIEGLTEFLPVSSTGHLIVFGDVLHFQGPPGKTFEITIQLGAILAVCWLYRQKLIDTALHLLGQKSAQTFTRNITLAFLPAVAIGLLFHHAIVEHLFSPRVVGISMIVGAFVIMAVEKWKPAPTVSNINDISILKAIAIGVCQSMAMIPGVSRSGATIMGSLLLGVERQTATEFSFFLAIPTMFAATVYDVFKYRHELSTDGISLIAVGFAVAFVSALACVRWLLKFVAHHNFVPFAWYRIAVGALILLTLH